MSQKQAGRASTLDLLSKGVYPAIAIVLTLCGFSLAVYTIWSNNDKQNQIDRLQAKMLSVQAQQQAYQEQAQRAEEQAHKMRVTILTLSRSVSPSEAQATTQLHYAILCSFLQMHERKDLGEDKAEELWDKARSEVEKKALKVARGESNFLL